MKKIGLAILATAFIFCISIFLLYPIVLNSGYNAVEDSYHAVTHTLLVALIFTVILCTLNLLEKLNKISTKSDCKE